MEPLNQVTSPTRKELDEKLRRVFRPMETLSGVFQTGDGTTYVRDKHTGSFRRVVPKMSKAMRRAVKKARHAAK